MKYKEQILAAFKKVGREPWDGQEEIINQLLVSFLDEDNKTIILSAPTGRGKSTIAVVTAEALHSILHPDQHEQASFLLSATNVLLDQYATDFAESERDLNFLVVKGASNYNCSALSSTGEPTTAEDCVFSDFTRSNNEEMLNEHCRFCQYNFLRQKKEKSHHLVTNYAYYYVDRLFMPDEIALQSRTLAVFDEGHLTNSLFVDFVTLELSETLFDKLAEEATLALGNPKYAKLVKDLKGIFTSGDITQENYVEFFSLMLQDVYRPFLADVNERILNMKDFVLNKELFKTLNKFSRKLGNLVGVTDKFVSKTYEHSYEFKQPTAQDPNQPYQLIIKPLFIGDMYREMVNSTYTLIMSATINETLVKAYMKIPGKVKFIKAPAVFPKKNKKVIFLNPIPLSYQSLQNPETGKKLVSLSNQIVNHHHAKKERGIILTPSFKLNSLIANGLKTNAQIFQHEQGKKLNQVLKAFKAYKGSAILLTPAGFEGIDLPNDQSRYQIIVKAPYGSLGDARMKRILDQYPHIYQLETLLKLVQGAGRSVRHVNDWATTYFIDSNIKKLWSTNNDWADEFQTIYTSQLE